MLAQVEKVPGSPAEQTSPLTLTEALARLKVQYRVNILFEERTLLHHTVSPEVLKSNTTLEASLKALLEPLGLRFKKKKNNYIILSGNAQLKKEPEAESQRLAPDVLPPASADGGSSLLSFRTKAERLVSGKVADEKGEGLPGVSILQKGTQRGTITDGAGNFSLEITGGEAILVFSFVGFRSQEVAAGNRATLDVVMQVDEKSLEEVVIVGYGTQKRVNMTGAVDVISGAQLESRPAPTVSQLLQGQSPGLNFSVGSSGMEPGASMNVNIRGIGSLNGGSPFVLIDGFPGSMDRLNPNDIESISVLKDAAASAIYGARAPYGVILITTKKGKREGKMTVSYNGNVSRNTPDRLPSMLDSYTFARVMNEMGDNAGGRAYPQATLDRIIAYQKGDWDYLKQFLPTDATHYETVALPGGRWAHTNDSHANYDWYKDFYGHSINQNHNVSIQGGSAKAGYYLSAGYVGQNGVLNYGVDTYRRYNLNAKINMAVNDRWDIRYETRFMKAPRERFNSENGSAETGYDLLFRQITRTVPTQAKYDPYGNYSMISKIPAIEYRGTDRTETTDNWQILATEFRPLKGWKINADFAYNGIAVDRSNRNNLLTEFYSDGRIVPLASTVPNRIEQITQNNHYWVANLFTTYDWQINANHHLQAMAGMQQEYDKTHAINVAKTALVVESVPSLQTANGDVTASERLLNWSTQGYFARVTYDFKEKYLFEVNGRYDGTSRFISNRRWGFFPSFSMGWNLDKENFWRSIQPYVNSFKVRASWGQLGNQQVSPYQDLALMPLNTGKLNWIFRYGDNRQAGYTGTPVLVSPNLTWETATTKNLGFNLSFLDHSLTTDVDIYERVTTDMIGPSEPVPGVLGAAVPSSNNATLRTRGWEVALKWNKRANANLSYYAGLNYHDARSFVSKYRNPTGLITDWYPGKEVGEIWGFTVNKLFQTDAEVEAYRANVDLSNIFNSWSAGDVKYEDINGDGKINRGANTLSDPGDLSIIGNNSPRHQFGLSAGVNFRSFDFSFLIRATAKRDYFFATGSNNIRYWGVNTIYFTGMTPEHLDYFRDKEGDAATGLYEGRDNLNQDAFWPKPYLDQAQNDKNRHASTRYLVNAAYIRLQNMQLGYTLPSGLLNKYSIRNLRVYASCENLFTRTGLMKGMDPVALTGFGGGAGATYGSDRIISLGLSLSL
ncbi:TonB-dependent receptor [Ravibacter arvi]|uniref:TonB-dependent receptor n=1 Tax=Ravibacter arvi TaxID=2051041 RepID=A0ABP8LWI9_9BACT